MPLNPTSQASFPLTPPSSLDKIQGLDRGKVGVLVGLQLIRELGSFRRCMRAVRQDPRSLVFYSEGATYSRYVEDVINQVLHRSDLKIYYLTSQRDDPVFAGADERFIVFHIDSWLTWVMPFIRARAIVMTMPDLGNLHIKKSTVGAHHFYLFHGIGSMQMVLRKGALDFFDSIFCVGEHQSQEIRKTEEVYGLAKKTLIEGGYPLLDRMYAHFLSRPEVEGDVVGPPMCLIAPSWNPKNILECGVVGMIEGLVKEGWRVVVRPHPEWIRHSPDKARGLADQVESVDAAEMEIDAVSNDSLYEADLLMTDWSSIAFEYAFATERPVLYIDTPPKINNPEYEKLGIPPTEIALRVELGLIVGLDGLERVPEIASNLLECRAQFQERIRTCRDRHVFNLGRSAEAIADHLIEFCSAAGGGRTV